MARKPSPKPKEKSPQPPPESSAPAAEQHEPAPLSARDHVFAIGKLVAAEYGVEPRDQELWALIEEQFVAPSQREINRYNRSADQMLCQKLENDERFREAVGLAKGQVF